MPIISTLGIINVDIKTPVALFTYNRPSHTQRGLEALSNCSRIDECKFYFFSDGPRTEAVRPQVDATRGVLKQWARRFNAKVIDRSENMGLAKSIVSGVTQLCRQYGCVIVLEDDLVVGPDFLHYMLESLGRYENEEKVMQIGGFTVSRPDNLLTDVFLLPVTTTWGWATWQRAWQHFSWQPKDLDSTKLDLEWRRLFDLNGTCSFSDMLEDRLANHNDSWGILWWYAVSRMRGLVAYPRNSLVWNGGFDGTGVHCGKSPFAGQNTPAGMTNMSSLAAPAFPIKTSYEPSHLIQMEAFFRSQPNNKLPGKTARGIYRKLKYLIKNIKGRVHDALH